MVNRARHVKKPLTGPQLDVVRCIAEMMQEGVPVGKAAIAKRLKITEHALDSRLLSISNRLMLDIYVKLEELPERAGIGGETWIN